MRNNPAAQQEAAVFLEALRAEEPVNARDLLDKHKDAPDILDAVGEELSKLDKKQQELISLNLRNLEKQISATEQNEETSRLKAQVETWRKSLETAHVSVSAEARASETTQTEETNEELPSTPPQGFVDTMKVYASKTKEWAKEQLDVTKWSSTKKATVATLTLGAAALLAYLAFRKSKAEGGEREKERNGFPKWLLWVPVLGIASWGAYKLYQHSQSINDITENLQSTSENIAGGAGAIRDIATGAGTELASTGAEVADTLYRDGKFWIDLFSKDDLSEAMQHFIVSGAILAVENGMTVLHVASRTIVLPGLSIEKFLKWGATGEKDEDIWLVYGQAGAAYFMGKTAFNLLARGHLQIPLTRKDALFTALKIGSGPLDMVADALSIGGTAARGAHGREAVYIRYARQNIVAKGMRKYRMWRLSGKPEGIQRGLKYWKSLMRDCDIMQMFKGEGKLFSEQEYEKAVNARKALANKIAKALNRLSPKDLEKSGLKELKKYSNLEVAEFEKWTDKYINDLIPSQAKNTVTTSAATSPHIPGELTEASPVRKAAGAERMTPEPAPRTSAPSSEGPRLYDPDNLLDKEARTASDAVTESADAMPRTTDELFSAIADARNAGDDARLAKLMESPLLRETAKNGNKEAQALLRARTFAARALSRGKETARIAGKVAGPALAGFGILLDTYLVIDNEVQLAEARKKQDALEIDRLEARGRSLKAAGIGGVATLALAGPAGLVVGAAVAAASVYTEAVYASVEEWNRTAESWKKLDTATLLQEIERYVGEVSAANVTASPGVLAGNLEGVNAVNSDVRSEIYAAYLVRSTLLPKMHAETDAQYADRVKLAVRSKLAYISNVTGRSFDRVTTDTLRNADAYAELVALKEKRRSMNLPLTVTFPSIGGDMTIDLEKVDVTRTERGELWKMLNEYEKSIKPMMTAIEMQAAFEAGRDAGIDYREKTKAALHEAVLAEIRHDVHRAEQSLRNVNFSGIADEHERTVVRMLIAAEQEKSVATLTELVGTETFTGEQFAKTIDTLRSNIQGMTANAQTTYDNAPDSMKKQTYGEEQSNILIALTS